MTHTPQRYDVRTFLIYIDSYEKGVPVGQYQNPCREESGQFRSLTELLLKLDMSLDIENIPQSFSKVRTFFPLTGYWLDTNTDICPGRGKMATFVVQVLFRRNSSWQGTITWLDERHTQNFRSVLELVFLMSSALGGAENLQWKLDEEYEQWAE